MHGKKVCFSVIKLDINRKACPSPKKFLMWKFKNTFFIISWVIPLRPCSYPRPLLCSYTGLVFEHTMLCHSSVCLCKCWSLLQEQPFHSSLPDEFLWLLWYLVQLSLPQQAFSQAPQAEFSPSAGFPCTSLASYLFMLVSPLSCEQLVKGRVCVMFTFLSLVSSIL